MGHLLCVEREQKLLMRGYEPHCPSRSCTGGHRNKLFHIKGKPNWLPEEVWIKKREEEIIYRCSYCGLVWFQEKLKRQGIDARPVGYYDGFDYPWEFVPLKAGFTIREQNTSRYWDKVGSKREAMHPPRRGGVDYEGNLVIDSEGNVLGSTPSEGLLKSSPQ
jgi:hypothetical protein